MTSTDELNSEIENAILESAFLDEIGSLGENDGRSGVSQCRFCQYFVPVMSPR